jgi:hypothetical protein
VVWVAAIVLFVEALGIALFNWYLGMLVDGQNMSMAGLDSDLMSRSSKIGGLVFGVYFGACAVSALLVALRERPPGLLGRVLLISAAVVHALLGAFTVGMVGWSAFVFMMVVFGLIVFTLLAYDRREAGPVDAAPQGADSGDGEGEGADAAEGTDGARAPEAPQVSGEGKSVDLEKGADARNVEEGKAVATSSPATSAS